MIAYIHIPSIFGIQLLQEANVSSKKTPFKKTNHEINPSKPTESLDKTAAIFFLRIYYDYFYRLFFHVLRFR